MATPLSRSLRAGPLTAEFLPEQGMTCASLRHEGEELLRGAIALLHPFANRLDGLRYRAAGRAVALDPASPLLRLDENGLPLHGVPGAQLAWEVLEASADQLRAQLAWTRPELLAVFPFPHRIELAVSLRADALAFETTLVAGSEGAVPVSFGFHPDFGLPGLERARWRLELPALQRLVLDARGIPTGEEVPFPAFAGELGGRRFDDGFRILAPRSVFRLRAPDRAIALEPLEGFSFLQLYAPLERDQVSIEPMTAPANALVRGHDLPIVAPGGRYRAAFRVLVN